VSIGVRPPAGHGPPPDRACDESPLAGFRSGPGAWTSRRTRRPGHAAGAV